MGKILSAIKKVDVILYAIAGGTLLGLVLITLVDVILRNFGHPITGSMEIIQYGGAIVFGFSVPYATFLKAQVQVDILTDKLAPHSRRFVGLVTRIMGIILFLFVFYNFILYGIDVKRTGEVSAAFRIPYYPIVYSLALSFLFQALTLFLDFVDLLRSGRNASPEADI